jgi:glutathione S-transferase
MELMLVSAEVCPFAQRSRLALLEKDLKHDVVEIDLRNKPAWFKEISPYSKVPVLLHGEHRIWESTIVNAYVEDVFSEPRLVPDTAAGRALMRIWIAFDDAKFVPATYKVLLGKDDAERRKSTTRKRSPRRFCSWKMRRWQSVEAGRGGSAIA